MKAPKTVACIVSMMFALFSFTHINATVGATMPFTTYEAEAGTLAGGATVVSQSGPPTTENSSPALEASGRAYVALDGTGQSVTWTNNTGQNIGAVTVRFCIPDSTTGGGTTGTLDLYVNGTLRQVLTMSSAQTWQYQGPSSHSTDQNPADGSPWRFWDELPVVISGTAIAPGSTITLQQDSTNTAAFYYIDCVDVEPLPAPITQPANSLSITSYGAVANNSGVDSTTAIQNCINAAQTAGKIVWIPSGTFYLNQYGTAMQDNSKTVAIEGAGIWYSEIYHNVALPNSGGANVTTIATLNGPNSSIQNVTLDTNATSGANVDGSGGGITMNGSNWLVNSVWVRHTGSGCWMSGSNGGTVENSRINNTWGDGINITTWGGLNNQTRGVGPAIVVTNNFVRAACDDCIATDSVATNNTSMGSLYGVGLGVYGGVNDIAANNLVSDIVSNSGMNVGTFGTDSGNLVSASVTGNTILRSGGLLDGPKHPGIYISGYVAGSIEGLDFSNNIISQGYFDGVDIGFASGLVMNNNVITSPGLTGINIQTTAALGNGVFNDNTVTNLNSGQAAFANFNSVGFPVDTSSEIVNSAIEASSFNSETGGINTQTCSEGGLNIDGIAAGSYTVYNNVNLNGVTTFVVREACWSAGTTLQVYLDSPTGTLIGTCSLPATGGMQTWATATCNLSGATGYHNVYLVNPTGNDHNIEWFTFQGNGGDTLEASSFNSQTGGVSTQACSEGGLNLSYISNGSYVVYNQVNLNGATAFTARVASAVAVGASAGSIGIYLDSPTGTLIGTCPVTGTGGWQTYTNVSCLLTGATGYHNIYLVFAGGSGSLFNLEWLAFQGALNGTEAASDNGLSGGETLETCSEGGQDLTTITNGAYAVYNNVDLNGLTNFTARVASTAAVGQSAGNIQIRLGSATGTLIGTCPVSGTGGEQAWTTVSCALSGASGYQNVYLVFTGGSGNLFSLEWFDLYGGIQEGINATAGASYNSVSGGIGTQSCSEGGLNLDFITNGTYAVYNNVNLTGMTSFAARVASSVAVGTSVGNIQIRLDSSTGTLIGTCPVLGTGAWANWATASCPLSSAATGYHNVYLVFTGGSGNLFNLEWFAWQGGISDIPAADYTSETGGISTQGCSEGGLNLDFITNGSYVVYDNINITGATTFTARVSSSAAVGTGAGNIQVRLGSSTGTLLGTCPVTGTGGWSNWSTVSCSLSNVPAGTQNLYLVFTGGSGDLFNLEWFSFNTPP